MSTLAASAVTAIIAALEAEPPVADLIERVRLRPWSTSTSSAISVRPTQAEVTQKLVSGQPVVWSVGINVECYVRVRSSDGLGADESVEDLLAATYARLMSDLTLAGAVRSIEPLELHYDFDSDTDQTACAILVLSVKQTCTSGTLFP